MPLKNSDYQALASASEPLIKAVETLLEDAVCAMLDSHPESLAANQASAKTYRDFLGLLQGKAAKAVERYTTPVPRAHT